jgi:hypothetical protein
MKILERQQHLGSVKLGSTRRKLLSLDMKHQITTTNIPDKRATTPQYVRSRVMAQGNAGGNLTHSITK